MKHSLLILFFLFVSYKSFSLSIRQVRVAGRTDCSFSISLDTEATELYYFSSWSYEISPNNLTLHVIFIKGFGSTIGYLNNNFEVSLLQETEQYFRLRVNVYYDDLSNYNLQDYAEGFVQTPLNSPIILSTNSMQPNNELSVWYSNPSHGIITLGTIVDSVYVFDDSARMVRFYKSPTKIIDMSNIKDGHYFILLVTGSKQHFIRIFLRKE